MNVVATVQARLGSERLPGKVLLDLNGRPVLWQIVRRLRAARLVDRVVIACPDDAVNRPIVEMAQASEIDCYAGSERDLVDRIYQAGKKYAADAVVWITADCPLIDPGVVDTVLQLYIDHQDEYDVVSTGKPRQPRPVPDGLDTLLVSFAALSRLWKEIKDPFWREWFAAYIAEHPDDYRYATLPLTQDMTHLRWTLDYDRDLDFVREVYRNLDRPTRVFTKDEVLALIAEHPEITGINRGYEPELGYKRALEAHGEDL